MNIGNTGSILFRMYAGTVVLLWSGVLILGGGTLVYLGYEPFRTRGFVMIAIGAVILGLSVLGMTAGGKKKERLADGAQREYDADEAIRRYIKQKAEAQPETPAAPATMEFPAPASNPTLPQRPVFGRRGSA